MHYVVVTTAVGEVMLKGVVTLKGDSGFVVCKWVVVCRWWYSFWCW